MRRSKWFSAVVLVLVFSVFLSACGGAKTSQQGTASTDTASASKVKADYVSDAGVFPIASKSDITLKFTVPQDAFVTDYVDNYFTKWLEQKSGVKYQFTMIPSADMATKVQLQMASNTDLPDAYIGLGRVGNGPSVFTTTSIIRYGAEGVIIPLNDYIEQYGVNTKALFKKYPDVGPNMTSSDGKIYYMPGYGPSIINSSPNKLWLNQGWLNKLGLKAPTTTDELYTVLKAFKEKDPNGNGKADEIPLLGTDENTTFGPVNYILGSFLVNNTQNSRLIANNGKLEFTANSNAWRKAMQYVNKLTSEGLLSKLSFTQNLAALKQIVNDPNDIAGGYVALGISNVAAANDQKVLSRYTGVAPVIGPDGVRTSVNAVPLTNVNGVVTSASKYPALVFRIFDLMIGEEASTINRYGEKGVNWEDPKPGQLSKFGGPATLVTIKNNWATPQKTNWQNFCPFVNDIHNDGEAVLNQGDPQVINAKIATEYKKYLPTNTVPILIYELKDVQAMNEIKINIDNYIKESIAKFAVGELDPNKDADWQKYVKEFDNMGLQNFMKVSQATLDRMNKK